MPNETLSIRSSHREPVLIQWEGLWAGAMVLVPLVVGSAIAVLAVQMSYFMAGG